MLYNSGGSFTSCDDAGWLCSLPNRILSDFSHAIKRRSIIGKKAIQTNDDLLRFLPLKSIWRQTRGHVIKETFSLASNFRQALCITDEKEKSN